MYCVTECLVLALGNSCTSEYNAMAALKKQRCCSQSHKAAG